MKTNLADAHWPLPDGIEETLPDEAWQLEGMRRRILDVYRTWGYRLTIPPMVEYLDSLLADASEDLAARTFKLTDPLSGRLIGIRADMTGQAARIAATHSCSHRPTRLCYLGTVLHTRAEGYHGSRAPIQLGAELYGNTSIEGDAEVISLMLETLDQAGVGKIHLDLGHVGIMRGLVRHARLTEEIAEKLFVALQRKSGFEISDILLETDAGSPAGDMFRALADLNGDMSILGEARRMLAPAGKEVTHSLAELETLAGVVCRRHPKHEVHIDLAELRGYRYHAGVTFAAFTPGRGQEIARGGRYEMGDRSRRGLPGTGFSMDLKSLLRHREPSTFTDESPVFAPPTDDPNLDAEIRRLRAMGTIVVQLFPGQAFESGPQARCLVQKDKNWLVE